MALAFALLGVACTTLLTFLAALALLQCAALGLLVAVAPGWSPSPACEASLRRCLASTLRKLACAISALGASHPRSRASLRRRRTSVERLQRSLPSSEAASLVSPALGATRLAPPPPDSLHLDGAGVLCGRRCSAASPLPPLGNTRKRRASDQAPPARDLVRARPVRRNSAGADAALRNEFVCEAAELALQARGRARAERHVDRIRARRAQSRLGEHGAAHVSTSAADGLSGGQSLGIRDGVRKSILGKEVRQEQLHCSSRGYEAPECVRRLREGIAEGRRMPPCALLRSPDGHVELCESTGAGEGPLLVNLLRRRAEERRPIQRRPPTKPRLGRPKEVPLFKQMMLQKAGALLAARRSQFIARQEREREAYLDSLMEQVVPPVLATEPQARKEQEAERERKRAVLRQALAMECGGGARTASGQGTGNPEVEAVRLQVLELERKYTEFEIVKQQELLQAHRDGFRVFAV